MATSLRRGCGILFFDKQKQRVLLFRRDDKPNLRFPNCIDILGGHVEDSETPDETIVREMAEELDDLRTRQPFKLQDFNIFKVYMDEWDTEQHIFWRETDFDISDIRLKEGKELVWLTNNEITNTSFAFGFDVVIKEFFASNPTRP